MFPNFKYASSGDTYSSYMHIFMFSIDILERHEGFSEPRPFQTVSPAQDQCRAWLPIRHPVRQVVSDHQPLLGEESCSRSKCSFNNYPPPPPVSPLKIKMFVIFLLNCLKLKLAGQELHIAKLYSFRNQQKIPFKLLSVVKMLCYWFKIDCNPLCLDKNQ